jgi:DNA-binding CsgD family transcriptional regulator
VAPAASFACRGEEARPYAVLAAPLPAGAAIAGTDRGAPSLLVVIHDPDARSAAAPESIAAIFSLPDATARLIAALAEGVEAKSYAEQQGITMDAVKFHLKTAFAKTGLRSQARLLQAVARALADISARRRPTSDGACLRSPRQVARLELSKGRAFLSTGRDQRSSSAPMKATARA